MSKTTGASSAARSWTGNSAAERSDFVPKPVQTFLYDKTVYYINNRKHGLEVYLPGATNRFVTVTGDVYRSGSVTRNDEALQNALDTFMRRANRVEGSRIEACS